MEKKKTFKRELAIAFACLLGYLIIGVGDVEMVKVVVWPLMSYIALSFGLDWGAKQLQRL